MNVLIVGGFNIHPYRNGQIEAVPSAGSQDGTRKSGPFPIRLSLTVKIRYNGEKIIKKYVLFLLPEMIGKDLYLRRPIRVGHTFLLRLSDQEDPKVHGGMLISEGT